MLFALGVGVVGAAVVAGTLAFGSGGTTADESSPVTLRAVTAEQRDLIEFTSLEGRVVYADPLVVTAATDSVVTDVVASGDQVERGMVLYEANALPITLFYGDIPLYRQLDEGVVGDDVLLLEENLASLGHHTFVDADGNEVDTGFVVDGVFDSATTEAVIRWQESVGIAATGVVVPTEVVIVEGPAIVTDLNVDVGSRVSQGGPIMTLNTIGRVDAAYVEQAGEIELFVSSGAALASGDLVYAAEGIPITAVVTEVVFDRDLSEGVAAGDDVSAIEEMLASLGYDANGELTVDGDFDEYTTQAVTEWEENLRNTFGAVIADGVLSLDQIVIVDPGATVGTITDHDSDVLASGTELWSTSTILPTRVVETSIAVADQQALAVGNVVDVEFPGGEVVQGTVSGFATSSTTDPTDPDAEAQLAVEIDLPSVPASVEALNEVDVEVKLVEEIAVGATVVPVSALIATGDGNYAVEALTSDGGTQLVAVEPGMFSDGWVEVVGIQSGTQVVVPS
jgi:peptidoglycan hydrolase-like protein with peptidoglycan-binding domain